MTTLANLNDEELLTIWEVSRRNGITRKQLSQTLDCTVPALRSKIYRANINKRKNREDHSELFEFDFGKPLELSGDFIVTGDVHSPFTDYSFTQLVSMVALKHLKKPRQLLLAGDIWDMGNFSKYESVIPAPTWRQEQQALKVLFEEWLDVFDNIFVIMGNHDRRLPKLVDGAFDDSDLVNLIGVNGDKIITSNFGWCVVNTEQGEYRVTHPRNYSQNQLAVAEKLAWKFRQNIISHHEHHTSIGWDRYKNHLLVNNGTLADYNKFAYVVLDDSTSAGMSQSFTLLKNGYPHLLCKDEPFTDWSLWI